MAVSDDMTSQMEMLSDDIVWHEIGSDEPIRGKQALAERYRRHAGGREHQGRALTMSSPTTSTRLRW